ncbi:MAG TPA: acetylxylan esterase [Verrucomicrobiae bacterium]|nr:acetylxylan esterase [Verrucomicrobiae bacterium]
MTTSTKSSASSLFGLLVAVLSFGGSDVKAAGPRALPEGQLPNDVRLKPPKDLDGYFPFTPAKSPEEWTRRAERVRRQILVSQGLWPMPTKTPLNPIVHGKIERDDYTVEKVYFESLPGFYVTGNLYRPKDKNGKLPGVLCPHGHWDQGRFMDQGEEGVRKEIAQGAERFEEGGRSVLQARCVQLARMGCVVFHYDMIGYADSTQISFEIAHRFAKQRPEMNTVENWGLYSSQAEAHFQSVMGLQTWNSIRSLDFLLGLPDVDPERIACTGASGGGTQTFILSAIDDRVKVAFPAVMVSTAMQGGCTCENSSGLRVGTGNVEFAALFAPRPLGLTSADDWTKEMATKGFPELNQHYTMLGAPDCVMLKRGEHFGHNYNSVSRTAMYSWLNKHLKLGLKEPVLEEDYRRLTREEMSVWDAQHPAPAGGSDFERRLLRWLTDDADKQLRELGKAPDKYRQVVGAAVDVIIGRNLDEVGGLEWDLKTKEDRGKYLEMAGLLRNKSHGEELPAVFLHPKQWNQQTVIWITDAGKTGLFADGPAARPKPGVQKLLDAGATVVGVDLLLQGEFLADGQPVAQTRRVKNSREAGAYTFGYNDTLFTQRVHDVLTVVKFVKDHERKSDSIDVIGLGAAGPWVAAALPQTKGRINRAVIESGDFRFSKVLDLHDPNLVPGGAKYGDLPGMIALAAPTKVLSVGKDGVTASSALDSLTRR